MTKRERARINEALMEAAPRHGFKSMRLADPDDPVFKKIREEFHSPSQRRRPKKRAKKPELL